MKYLSDSQPLSWLSITMQKSTLNLLAYYNNVSLYLMIL